MTRHDYGFPMASSKTTLKTAADAGKDLGVSLATVWRMIRRGELPTVRVGRRRYVDTRALKARIRRNEPERLRPFDMDNAIWKLVGAYRSEGALSSQDKHALLDE
jgi:excisionase family DNA binding protein